MNRALVLALTALTLSGCEVTEVYTAPDGKTIVRHINQDDDFENTTEGQLLGRAQEKDDARSWFQLGDYYDRRRDYSKAILAYQNMQVAIQKEEKSSGQRFVGGLYLLGKCHALVRQFQPAIGYLQQVLAAQPKDLKRAVLNPYFKEAHYLLGAIYYEHNMYEEAEKHLVTFRELAGGRSEHRADAMLIRIDEELYPERNRPLPDDAPSRPSGQVDPDKQGKVFEEQK